jgi:hypothetical protein
MGAEPFDLDCFKFKNTERRQKTEDRIQNTEFWSAGTLELGTL